MTQYNIDNHAQLNIDNVRCNTTSTITYNWTSTWWTYNRSSTNTVWRNTTSTTMHNWTSTMWDTIQHRQSLTIEHRQRVYTVDHRQIKYNWSSTAIHHRQIPCTTIHHWQSHTIQHRHNTSPTYMHNTTSTWGNCNLTSTNAGNTSSTQYIIDMQYIIDIMQYIIDNYNSSSTMSMMSCNCRWWAVRPMRWTPKTYWIFSRTYEAGKIFPGSKRKFFVTF